MRLIFESDNDSRQIEWAEYALLRDNVQHYVECGSPREDFGTLHAIEEAVDTGVSRVNAVALREELRNAWDALGGLKLEAGAVSLRTRAFVTGCRGAPSVRATALAKLTGWSLPVPGPDDQLLQEAVRPFFDAVMALTRGARVTDTLSVTASRG
jgi:hypothetical protein